MTRFPGVALALTACFFAFAQHATCGEDLPKPAVVILKHVAAAEAVKKVTKLLGKDCYAEFMVHEDANAVFIRATPEATKRAKQLFERLDVNLERGYSLIRLNHANGDAVRMCLKLMALLDGDAPQLGFISGQGKEVLFSATASKRHQAAQMIRWLDDPYVRAVGRLWILDRLGELTQRCARPAAD